MASKENQPRANGPPRKRPSECAEGTPVVKKRVVLGEVTNTSSTASGLSQLSGIGKTQKPKPKPKPLLKKTGNEVNLELLLSPGSDEPQKLGCASSIYQHLHSLEVEAKRRPLSNYMEKVQKDISPVMRAILVDWLVEVAEEFKLISDTLYLTVNYIDRYLSTHNLIRNKLQLLGVSCMLVASKYEEITPPHVEDFCYITDNTYTKEEVLHMERNVLRFLDFELGNPTTKTFLRIFSRAAQEKPMFSNLQLDFLCHYLTELSLLDYGCVRYIPSMVAASAIFLARLTIQPKLHPWTQALQQHTGYRPYELKECILRLHNLQLKSETSSRAVRQKYMDYKASSLEAEETSPVILELELYSFAVLEIFPSWLDF
ncbi:putative cyclin-A3-1 [Sesamum angolense]|uniref:Cyclin-A3-1 n=1 Tax=Sesamum angolense TaxID=2727404 RepID=A0AAE1WYX6_9LAMI|nr:putative cyclin-A3-1 [Sesamum angolense]